MVLAISSMLMSKQCILIRCRYTEIHLKQGMYWLVDENVVTRDSQKPNLVFLLAKMVQHSLISCCKSLYNITTADKNRLYVVFQDGC